MLPAVKNSYIDYYTEHDFFDLSYADTSTCLCASMCDSSATA